MLAHSLTDTHIPALTHDKNKMPAKQRQNQSSVKYRTQGSNMLLYKVLSSSLKSYLLIGHFHLLPCLLPDGAVWSDRLRSNTTFEIRVCLSLRKHLEEWKILQQNLGAVKQIFLSVGFQACLLYLRTGLGHFSHYYQTLSFNE